MFYNFLKPRKTFEEALSSDTMTDAWMIALVSGIIFGIATWLFTADTYPAIGVTIVMIIQFLLLCGIIYILEFMMKNKKKRIADKSFTEIASATAKLWQIVLLMGIFLLINLLIGNQLIVGLTVLIIALLGLLFFYNLFILIKVVMEAKTARTIVSLVIIIILHGMLTELSLIILGAIM